jgi:2-polyprenyl-3-methyl-5-hydroxy-6-metoxy-1,4-benzoquinol methylase
MTDTDAHGLAERTPHYRKVLFDQYFSTHYAYIMPATAEDWIAAVERIDLNLGSVFAEVERAARILDVGCGVGYLPYYLARQGFSRVVAIDISEEQLAVAKEQLRRLGVDPEGVIDFGAADVFSFLEVQRDFDVIASFDVIEHLDKERAFRLMELCYGALRSPGILLLRTTNMDNPLCGLHFYKDFTHETGFTPGSITQCLRAIGFEKIDVFYERLPLSPKEKRSPIRRARRAWRMIKRRVAGKFMGVRPEAFSEDIVVVARK